MGVRVNDGFVDDATLVAAAPVSTTTAVAPAVWVAIFVPRPTQQRQREYRHDQDDNCDLHAASSPVSITPVSRCPAGVVMPAAKTVTVGRYLALSGRVPHMPPMISHASPTFIQVCVIFDSLPLPSTLPSGKVSTRVNR
jgi:hypothetical protein